MKSFVILVVALIAMTAAFPREVDTVAQQEFSLADVTSVEFAGHHSTANEACACCHAADKSAECYSMKCGDGSDDLCWTKNDTGAHPGWGTIGDHGNGYHAGADECSAKAKRGYCPTTNAFHQ